ncbi:MAG: tetratricopeptide repeat protein [Thermoguttaceae bacterium]
MKTSTCFCVLSSFLLVLCFFFFCDDSILGQSNQLIQATPPNNPLLLEGIRAALRGENDEAARLFAEANQNGIRPGGIDAALAFTDPSFEYSAFRKLRFWLEKTAEDYPNDPEAFLLLAKIALDEERYFESTMLVDRAIPLIENYHSNALRQIEMSIEAAHIRAKISEQKEQWQETVVRLQELIRLEPNNAQNWCRLGLAQFRLGETEAAIQSLNMANQKDANILPASVLLAQFSEYNGNRELAERFLKEAMEMQSDNPQVLLAAADLELRWNRIDEAQKNIIKAQTMLPDSPEVEAFLGLLDLYKNEYENAEKHFTAALQLNPEQYRSIIGLALSLSEQNDAAQLRRALTILRSHLSRNPNSVDAKTTLAWILMKMDQVEESEKLLLRLFDANELNSAGGYTLASIYSRQNRKKEAILFLKSILESSTNFPKRIEAEKLLKELEATQATSE